MFLRAKLVDGTEVISEFTKLGKVQRYVNQVFGGAKPFNAWRVTGSAHPVSGEKVLQRTREMLNGSRIVSIAQVEPTTQDHGYDPANFRLAETMQKGEFGFFTVPAEDAPEGLAGIPAGTQFPIKRDEHFRKYITLRLADPAAEVGSAESVEGRFYLDEVRQANVHIPDENDDWGDGDDEDYL